VRVVSVGRVEIRAERARRAVAHDLASGWKQRSTGRDQREGRRRNSKRAPWIGPSGRNHFERHTRGKLKSAPTNHHEEQSPK
jgi:hypothetical protein